MASWGSIVTTYNDPSLIYAFDNQTGAFCVPLSVPITKSFWSADHLWLGLAFLIGFIIGALIAFGCSRLCMKDILKHRQQKNGDIEANQSLVTQSSGRGFISKKQMNSTSAAAPTKGKKKKKGKFRGKGKAGDEEPLMPISPIILDEDEEEGGERGLLDALVKESGADLQAEVAGQELDAFTKLEKELREQNIETMMQLLRALLNKQLQNGKLTPEQSKDLMKNAQDNIHGIIGGLRQERKDEEERISKIKDPEKREKETLELDAIYNQKMVTQLQDEKERLRHDLTRQGLTDADVDAIMNEYSENEAYLRMKLAEEKMRQAASLEERLQRRRHLAELQNEGGKLRKKEIIQRVQVGDGTLTALVEAGKLGDRVRDQLINQYHDDLNRIHGKHEEGHQKARLSLAEKLRVRREGSMRQLQEEQDKQKEGFLRKSDKMVDTSDVIEGYSHLLQQHRGDMNGLMEELDNEEDTKFKELTKEEEKGRQSELTQREAQFTESLRQKADLSDREAQRIMALHEEQMDELAKMKKAERIKMRKKLEQRLEAKRQRSEDDKRHMLAEQQILKDQQDLTIQKVLGSQIELSEDAKQRIMQEHEQQMVALSGQLSLSRQRQQKALDLKLAQRRAKLEETKLQLEETRVSRRKDREKLENQLEKQIAEEEQNIEEERKKASNELRERLARETAASLQEQERQLGQLIARLQVGQARRQALIQKQDQTIKDLEEKMATKVAEKTGGGDLRRSSMAHSQVDQLLEEHLGQVSNLNERLTMTKEHQDQILKEKLDRKRLQKERDLESRLEHQAQQEWHQKQQTGQMGYASSLLSQAMLDTRHKNALRDLEREMQNDMQKQREELNQQLEVELNKELQDQKKNFLAQLAAVSNLTKDDVDELVEHAVIDTGGNTKKAQQLSKEMRISMKRAKSDMGELSRRASMRRESRDYVDPDGDESYPQKSYARDSRGADRPMSRARSDMHPGYGDEDYRNQENEKRTSYGNDRRISFKSDKRQNYDENDGDAYQGRNSYDNDRQTRFANDRQTSFSNGRQKAYDNDGYGGNDNAGHQGYNDEGYDEYDEPPQRSYSAKQRPKSAAKHKARFDDEDDYGYGH